MASTLNLPPKTNAGLPRVDGPLKVSGVAMYTSDHNLPGMLYAVPVCATIANVNNIVTTTTITFVFINFLISPGILLLTRTKPVRWSQLATAHFPVARTQPSRALDSEVGFQFKDGFYEAGPSVFCRMPKI